jgi:hypothetical protein
MDTKNIFPFLPFGDFVVIWYIFSRCGIFYQEKSGNPESK